jgi:hypothetical protein
MHPLFQKADDLSRQAIGAAIEVHRIKGPGLIESILTEGNEGNEEYRALLYKMRYAFGTETSVKSCA